VYLIFVLHHSKERKKIRLMNFQRRTPLTCGNPIIEKRILEMRQRKHLACLEKIQPVVGMRHIEMHYITCRSNSGSTVDKRAPERS